MKRNNGTILFVMGLVIVALGVYLTQYDTIMGVLAAGVGLFTVINSLNVRKGEDSPVNQWAKKRHDKELEKLREEEKQKNTGRK
ncbi:hypothetical protein B8A33_06685 [Dolosigranulum pigrum]|uniref:hypothetical protein n=1 Tax=Dolosigranulum pigrum TaxID=29394 RepID=UPI000DC04065|nr:hypothetical protein [Dolosigranulum pigrum]RAN55921.1 hypothetical protein B8A33_06685 [Dolosigranulum pigrum]